MTTRNTFNSAIENELTMSETVRTENGAVMHASTGKTFLDAFWKISSCRNIQDENQIIHIFAPCFKENFELACRLLFYIRDCRGGCGEKRIFQILFNWLLNKDRNSAIRLSKLIPEYGSWRDIVLAAYKSNESSLYELVLKQLNEDITNCENGKPISLLAKWCPSVNTSSKKTVEMAKMFCKRLGYTHTNWRKTLSRLRKHIDIIERKMCSGKWNEIDYNAVPSKANLIYKNAFMKHDEQRRKAYLNQLAAGDVHVKMNAAVLEPYEIVHNYVQEHGRCSGWASSRSVTEDAACELLWKNLPRNDALQEKNMICVHDNSYSMSKTIAGTTISCHDVADALAIYCSELLKGDWKDKFITFSEQPKMIDLYGCDSLAAKIGALYRKVDWRNTNIKAVFDIILKIAVESHCKQEDIPDVLVLSDMEFDALVPSHVEFNYAAISHSYGMDSDTLFEIIREKFARHGYQMPKLIFWNIGSSTMGIPVRENENGVLLVSGFSKNIFNMVASGKLDPFEALKDQLNAKRYDAVEEALKTNEE